MIHYFTEKYKHPIEYVNIKCLCENRCISAPFNNVRFNGWVIEINCAQYTDYKQKVSCKQCLMLLSIRDIIE